ncbi:MAG TPA: carboxypeptidase-like regulatory domain-containing protein [Candidatus Krumholzibacteria bacterium]|nr:carboxypeptidase-like regulatory domain-containing protein [Candidatus Krumholzibacteria bacterium]
MKLARVSALAATVLVATSIAAHAFNVKGTVTNGTTGKPVASAHVIVIQPSAGMKEVGSTEARNGQFEVLNLSNSAPIFVLRVEYEGTTYNEPVRVTGADQTVDVAVFESTPSWTGVSVTVPHLAVAREGDELMVEQMYEITNATLPAKTVSAPNGAFRVFLPADMDSLVDCYVDAGQMPLKLTPTPTDAADLYALDYPIRPGVTRVTVSYTVPYTSGSYTMAHKFAEPVTHMSVFAIDSTMQVSSSSHQFANTESVHGMTAYAVHDIKANSTVTLVFSGGDPNFAGLNVDENGNATQGGGAQPDNVMPRFGEDEKISYFLMVTVLLVLAGVAGMSLRDRHDPLSDPQVLRAHYDLLLSRLARLDDLHTAHTIPDDVYRASRDEMMGRLAALAMHLRSHGGVHAPAPAPDRPAPPEATSKVQ